MTLSRNLGVGWLPYESLGLDIPTRAERMRCQTGLLPLVKFQVGGVVSVLPAWPGGTK